MGERDRATNTRIEFKWIRYEQLHGTKLSELNAALELFNARPERRKIEN